MLSAWNLWKVSVPLPREEITTGLVTEYERFGDLLRSLSAGELSRPTRCTGWTVGDVGAHVVGTMADITAGKFEGLGTPEVTQREVDERKGRSGDELADEMEQVRKIGIDLMAAFDDESWNGPAPGGLAVTVAGPQPSRVRMSTMCDTDARSPGLTVGFRPRAARMSSPWR